VQRVSGALSLCGVGLFVATTGALHWLQPDLDPLDEAVSYYIHGRGGWLLTVGLMGLGLGSLALTAGIAPMVRGAGARLGCWMLAIWSICVLLGGAFAADPRGSWNLRPSISGLIHGNAALAAFVALPVAGGLLSRSFGRDPRWQTIARTSSLLTVAMIASLLTFAASLTPVFISPGPPWLLGLTERILLTVYSVWLCVVGVGLFRGRD
jgi:hypothetical protein